MTKQLTTSRNAAPRLAEEAKAISNEMGAITKAKMGQPTKRTDDIISTILNRISCGESLLQICQDADMPGYSTVKEWKRKDPELHTLIQEAYLEFTLAIDDANEDILRGGILSTGDLQRDLALVNLNKWRLGKLNRVQFGERVDARVSVSMDSVVMPIEALMVIDAEPMPPEQ